jgi:hypothetical protein
MTLPRVAELGRNPIGCTSSIPSSLGERGSVRNEHGERNARCPSSHLPGRLGIAIGHWVLCGVPSKVPTYLVVRRICDVMRCDQGRADSTRTYLCWAFVLLSSSLSGVYLPPYLPASRYTNGYVQPPSAQTPIGKTAHLASLSYENILVGQRGHASAVQRAHSLSLFFCVFLGLQAQDLSTTYAHCLICLPLLCCAAVAQVPRRGGTLLRGAPHQLAQPERGQYCSCPCPSSSASKLMPGSEYIVSTRCLTLVPPRALSLALSEFAHVLC